MAGYKKIPKNIIEYELEVYNKLTYIRLAFEDHKRIQDKHKLENINLPIGLMKTIRYIKDDYENKRDYFSLIREKEKKGKLNIKVKINDKEISFNKGIRLCKWLEDFYNDNPNIIKIDGQTIPTSKKIKFDFPDFLSSLSPIPLK